MSKPARRSLSSTLSCCEARRRQKLSGDRQKHFAFPKDPRDSLAADILIPSSAIRDIRVINK